MDIKDFILIVGGLLIAAVLTHGFWTGWRARREPLRIEIVPELPPEAHDEMDRFRGELPNGGGRLALSEQASLELGQSPDELLQHALEGTQTAEQPDLSASEAARRALDLELLGEPQEPEVAIAKRAPAPRARKRPSEPDLFTIPEGYGPDEEVPVPQAPANTDPLPPRVAEVTIPESVADPDPLVTEAKPRPELRVRRPANQPLAERRGANSSKPERGRRRLGSSKRKPDAVVEPAAKAEPVEKTAVEELLMIHLVAPSGERFQGAALFAALREQGLKYGDMSIFHRTDPMLKAPIYSVANAVEPGFFDLSDLDAMSTPGVTFFLQLPGPEEPSAALADMLKAATAISHKLGGELRDESRNRLTRQVATHMQQRVSDFSLRRLSREAL